MSSTQTCANGCPRVSSPASGEQDLNFRPDFPSNFFGYVAQFRYAPDFYDMGYVDVMASGFLVPASGSGFRLLVLASGFGFRFRLPASGCGFRLRLLSSNSRLDTRSEKDIIHGFSSMDIIQGDYPRTLSMDTIHELNPKIFSYNKSSINTWSPSVPQVRTALMQICLALRTLLVLLLPYQTARKTYSM